MTAVLVVLALAALVALVIRHQVAEEAREQAEALESRRMVEVRAFAERLFAATPDVHLRSRPTETEIRNGSSEELTERLLDLCDGIAGPVLGQVRAAGSPWPSVAARHALRGRPAAESVGERSLPLRLPEALRPKHLVAFGKTGSGKTVCIANQIIADIRSGRGIAVICKEAELLDQVLCFVPPLRLNDVIVVDPGDSCSGVPLNPLVVLPHEDVDVKTDEVISALGRMFADDGPAPRAELIFGKAIATLLRTEGSTLLDVPRLLDRGDDAVRRSIVAKLADEELRDFWAAYPSFPRDAHLPILHRLGRLLVPKVRNLLCRPGALDIRTVMDQRKILLVLASDGVLGPRSAQIIAGLVAGQIQLATMARARQAPTQRRPFTVYVDEFAQLLGADANTYATLLTRARKYGVALVMATQTTTSLPDALLRSILGNVGSLIAFATGADDARRLGREFAGTGGQVEAELRGLRVGEALVKLERVVVRARMLPPPTDGSLVLRDEALRRSRERYGSAAPVPSRSTPQAERSPLDTLDPTEVF